MKLSLNSFEPYGYRDNKEGTVPGYGLNKKYKFTAHCLTGAAYGVRHLKLAFFSESKGFELGLARCYHVAIGLVECIPVIGSVVALADRCLFEKQFGRYAEYTVQGGSDEKRSATKLLKEYGFSVDGKGNLKLPEGLIKDEQFHTITGGIKAKIVTLTKVGIINGNPINILKMEIQDKGTLEINAEDKKITFAAIPARKTSKL